MTHFNKSIFRIAIIMASMTAYSCGSQDDIIEDINENVSPTQLRTCAIDLNIKKDNFADQPETRSESGWNNGDRVYITFSATSGQNTSGYAEYSDSGWTFNYYGMLETGGTAKCTAVYFDNPDAESGSVVNLTENTAIYEDNNCQYTVSNNNLSITATLKPKTGRIRFTGGSNPDKITLYGITHYTSYDWSTGNYTEISTAITEEIKGSSTPYVYGYYTDTTSPRLNLISASSAYTRPMTASTLSAGKSGYMTIPTQNNHSGWQTTLKLMVNNVEFTLIPVEYSSGNFLLGETEVTEQLYYAIMGGSTILPQRPIVNVSCETLNKFVDKLNDITGFKFRFPSEYEWKHAAGGGNNSNGYTFSGSNVLSEVGWYLSNSSGSVHNVKQLKPNELGFYDMSGNAFEITGSYSYSYQTAFGGSYDSAESDCKISFRGQSIYYTTVFDDLGLRLALSNKN